MRAWSVTILAAFIAAAACGKPARVPRVAILSLLSHSVLSDSVDGIRQGLAESGYSGDRLQITEASLDGRMHELGSRVQELLATRPDVLIPVSREVTDAVVRHAADEQAVVFVMLEHPADIRLETTRPNVSGVSPAVNATGLLDLVRSVAPGASKVAFICDTRGQRCRGAGDDLARLVAGRSLSMQLIPGPGFSSSEAARAVVEADVTLLGPGLLPSLASELATLAMDSRRPLLTTEVADVEAGALAGLVVDYRDLGRRAGLVAGQVLRHGKGAGEFPEEEVHGSRLVLNQRTAARLGLTIPADLVTRAGRVIQ